MTTEQKIFTISQGLPEELFFDAKGQTIGQIKNQMQTSGKLFAYDTTPCTNFGHTLKSIAGHCIQCNTANIEFTLRHFSFGIVYVAGSIKGRLIKIGTTYSKEVREKSLNTSKYGNLDDWEILFTCKCFKAGNFENEISKHLGPYRANISYDHDNHSQQSIELFKCNYKRAITTLFEVKDKLRIELMEINERKDRVGQYNDFPSLRKL